MRSRRRCPPHGIRDRGDASRRTNGGGESRVIDAVLQQRSPARSRSILCNARNCAIIVADTMPRVNHIKFHRRATRFLAATTRATQHFLQRIRAKRVSLIARCAVNASIFANRANYRLGDRLSFNSSLPFYFSCSPLLSLFSFSPDCTRRAHPFVRAYSSSSGPLGVSYELNVPWGFWGPVDPTLLPLPNLSSNASS